MTIGRTVKLLVSVRDSSEARDALLGGADWIDLKEPLAGPLGPVCAEVAQSVIAEVGGARPVSAAMGELRDWPCPGMADLVALRELAVVKLGLADCVSWPEWEKRWREAFEICRQAHKDLAAVVYADYRSANAPIPCQIIECASRAGGKYLLIDTFNKQFLSSLQILGTELAKLLRLARERGLITVLAGGLSIDDLLTAAELPVDIVAIRGAACRGGRTSILEQALVQEIRARLNSSGCKVQELNSCLTADD